MRKVKEIKGLRGGVLKYAAQEILKIDTEIAQKGHVWMETASLERGDHGTVGEMAAGDFNIHE